MENENFFFLIIFFFFFETKITSQTFEYQGAKLRILNKDTTEKNFYILPLSQTLEINNTVIVVHRCLKINTKERQDEIALISHKSYYEGKLKMIFLVGYLNLLIT